MNAPSPSRPRLFRGLLKWLLRLFLLLIVIVVVASLLASRIATSQANRQMARQLRTHAEVDRIDLGLLRGHAGISGLRMDQPEGWGDSPMLQLDSLGVEIDLWSLRSGTPRIQEIGLSGLHLHVITRQSGTNAPVSNFQAALPEPPPTPESAPAPEEPGNAAEPGSLRLAIDAIRVEDLSVRITQEFDEGEPFDFTVTNLQFRVSEVLITPEPGTQPAQVDLYAELVQPQGTNALLAVRMRVLPDGTNLPAVALGLDLTGFQLESLGRYNAPKLTKMLGATLLDAGVTGRLDRVGLDITGGIRPMGGVRFPLTARGPYEKLDISGFDDLLAAAGLHALAKVGVTALEVGSAAVKTGEAALATGSEAVSKVADTAGTLVGGLGKTLGGVVSLDKDKISEGLKQGTVGTVKAAGEGVLDVGKTAVGGLGEALDTARGSQTEAGWLARVPDRHEASVNRSRSFVDGIDLRTPAAPNTP